jgi:hypothetical protein
VIIPGLRIALCPNNQSFDSRTIWQFLNQPSKLGRELERSLTDKGHAFHSAILSTMIWHRVVLSDAIIPLSQASRSPAKANLKLGQRSLFIEATA